MDAGVEELPQDQILLLGLTRTFDRAIASTLPTPVVRVVRRGPRRIQPDVRRVASRHRG
jgi:hypothetical protein